MKVEFVGFSITAEGPITLETLMLAIEKKSGVLQKGGAGGRQYGMSTKVDDDYYAGVVLTIKDQKRFLEWREGKVVVHEISEFGKMMEFNYYAINRKTGAGLYQRYHNSSSLSGLCERLKKYHRRLHQHYLETEFQKIPDITLKQKAAIRKKNKGDFSWRPLFSSKQEVQKMLQKLDRISHVKIDAEYKQTKESLFKPAAGTIKSIRQSFSMNRNVVPAMVLDAVYNAANEHGVEAVSVDGYKNGIYALIKLADHVEVYRHFDFDDVVLKLKDIDPLQDLDTCWVVGQLLQACKAAPNIHHD
jgi:hypothetical protein